jgi:putative IMPACT (imprinted ancient) family translation regulator
MMDLFDVDRSIITNDHGIHSSTADKASSEDGIRRETVAAVHRCSMLQFLDIDRSVTTNDSGASSSPADKASWRQHSQRRSK